jgi:hypothetical protein
MQSRRFNWKGVRPEAPSKVQDYGVLSPIAHDRQAGVEKVQAAGLPNTKIVMPAHCGRHAKPDSICIIRKLSLLECYRL